MALQNPFRRKTPATRNAWGYKFDLSPLHLSPAEMDPMKRSYDRLGEGAFIKLSEIARADDQAGGPTSDGPCSPSLSNHQNPPKPRKDLYILLRENAAKDKWIGRFWEEVTTVPSWVKWDQIAEGQECFYRYGGPALTALAFHSLLGGMV